MMQVPDGTSSSSTRRRWELERLIQASPSPTLARVNLARLLENGGARSLDRIERGDLFPLFTLLGGSDCLSDILIRQGPGWPSFFSRQIRRPQKTVSDHLAEMRAEGESTAPPDRMARLLREHKQKEFLRIGLRDLCRMASVDETVRELTFLADAALEAAYRSCRPELERDFGPLHIPDGDRPNRFAILGMGKLGGSELNFSSDIDLVYLYERDEGMSAGGAKGKKAPRDFFSLLADRISRMIGEVTDSGFVFRVDLRLRPFGRHGPLVHSLESALLYYESWGQCWERAALIKARPVAGDRSLGAEFLKSVAPFIYRRYLDFTTVEELRHMKARIEKDLPSRLETERNVKLGRGGIREVEFFIQTLQLIHGGQTPDLREPNSINALKRLVRHKFTRPNDGERLERAYRFLRDVEHKIQIVNESRTHTIPDDPAEEEALARRLGYRHRNAAAERGAFWRDHRRQTNRVRAAFERLFYGGQKGLFARGRGARFQETWSRLDQKEPCVRELAAAGFVDPENAHAHLLAVGEGEAYDPPSPRRLAILRSLGPALLTEIARSPSPDQALLNFREFSRRIGGRTGFFSLLAENPKTLRLLIMLFAGSQFLTDLFLRRPEILDSLMRTDLSRTGKDRAEMAAEAAGAVRAAEDFSSKLNALRRYRAEEFLRIGLHDLGCVLNLEKVSRQLSDLAEAALEGALIVAREEIDGRFGTVAGGKFAVLGLGKLGGRELDYNSDLDLIFIYDAAHEAYSSGGSAGEIHAHDYHVRLGQKLITCLTTVTEEGTVYKIDMRLRPSGRAGPLVSSLAAFRKYHDESAELWERQSLIKARFVAGDADLGARAEEIARLFAYRKAITPDEALKIDHLRGRMERELAQENARRFNLKTGRGGLVDIEFLVQMLQLVHGTSARAVRETGTAAALRALKSLKAIRPGEYRRLLAGYRFLRRLDHRIRLERDQPIEILEREPDKLESIARALGYKGRAKNGLGARLLVDYELTRERVRACYEASFAPVRSGRERQSMRL
jgi:glutamate-ammonia-ligase adenylyltransferase